MSDRAGAAAEWWRAHIADRDHGAARGQAARLRRAKGVEALAEPAVQGLAQRLGMGPAQAGRLVSLAGALAELRSDDKATLPARLGGHEQRLSPARFQRLLRARDEDFDTQLRRAIVMAERRCNVARLAGDLMLWDHPDRGDPVRARWSFDYFATPAPKALTPEETTQ